MNRNKLNIIKKVFAGFLRAVLICGISFIILQPLIIKVSSSFMTVNDLYDQTVKWIPMKITLDNYISAWEIMDYPVAFKNSLFLTIIVSILQGFSCTLVGYSLARFDFPGRKILFSLVIFTLIIPPHMILIPLFLNFRFFNIMGILPGNGINLIGTYWPFILTSITATGLRNGLFVYIMRQFFKGMPRELEEAAYIDGAGMFKTFYKVMLPGAIPGLVIVFLFSFVWQWNDYLYVTIFLEGGTFLTHELQTLAYEITGVDAFAASPISTIVNNTGMLMFIAPLLLLYIFMQRYFIESVERSGIVG